MEGRSMQTPSAASRAAPGSARSAWECNKGSTTTGAAPKACRVQAAAVVREVRVAVGADSVAGVRKSHSSEGDTAGNPDAALKEDIRNAVSNFLLGVADSSADETDTETPPSPEAHGAKIFSARIGGDIVGRHADEPASIVAAHVPKAGMTSPGPMCEAAEAALALDAVETLYSDRIEPESVLIRKRIQELSGEHWDIDKVLAACKTAGVLTKHLPKTSGGRFIARLPGHPADFVDPSVPGDYPDSVWDGLHKYFSSAAFRDGSAPATSNYKLALTLHEEDVAGLQSYCLGEVCRVVHMCVEKRMLGHAKNGSIKQSYLVPFAESDEFKKLSAVSDQPCAGSWDELREKLSTMFREGSSEEGYMLSTFKKRFLRRFGVELNEARFEHSKLATLLSDEKLESICTVYQDGTTAWVKPGPALRNITPESGKVAPRKPTARPRGGPLAVVETKDTLKEWPEAATL